MTGVATEPKPQVRGAPFATEQDWDDSIDLSKIAPFLATLLFGKCPMFDFSRISQVVDPERFALDDDSNGTPCQGTHLGKQGKIESPPSDDLTGSLTTTHSLSTQNTCEDNLVSRKSKQGDQFLSGIPEQESRDDNAETSNDVQRDDNLSSASIQCQRTTTGADIPIESITIKQRRKISESKSSSSPEERRRGKYRVEVNVKQPTPLDRQIAKEDAKEAEEGDVDKTKVRFNARFVLPADFEIDCRRNCSPAHHCNSNVDPCDATTCNLSLPKSVNSRAASIVSASRCVKSLIREIEVDAIDEESDKSPYKENTSSKRIQRKTNAGKVDHVTSVTLTDSLGRTGKYTGSFSRLLETPHGFGRFEFDSGRQWYEGNFKRGEWEGQGRCSEANGDFYKGFFYFGIKHGTGVLKFADGRVFEGQFLHGQIIHGLMKYQDGSSYYGDWLDGMRHGHGHSVFSDHSVYVGEFREGEFSGYGKMMWMDGGYYEGEWEKGEMHGFGKEIYKSGNMRHEGQWARGQPIRNGHLGAM